MKTIKKAFTLAEVLVSMAIIGVVMAVSVQTIKIVQASYTSLAFFEFNNIKAIAGEAIGGNSGSTPKDAKGNYVSDVSVRKGSRMVITSNNSTFCKYVTAISNVAKQKRQDGLDLCDEGTLFDVEIIDNEPTFKDFDELEPEDKEPTFITNSGKFYYLSKWIGPKSEDSTKGVSDNYGYRLLAVDLNGKKRPNLMETYENRKIPDIVKFMIMDNGEIFPLGVAADNLQVSQITEEHKKVIYIMANVKGYYFTSKAGRSEDVIPADCKRQIADKDGKPTGTKQCDFAVVNVTNPFSPDNPEAIIFSYRQAYCLALGNRSSEFTNYCNSATVSGSDNYCPPSSSDQAFDECRVRNIKPAFRYNL